MKLIVFATATLALIFLSDVGCASLDQSSFSNLFNFKQAVVCGFCRSALYVLKNFINSETEIEVIANFVCRAFKFGQENSCKGYSRLFAPHLSYVLKNSNLTGSQMCGVILGKKCLTNPPSIYENWTIALPPPPKGKPDNFKWDLSQQRILHLSDFHFDPFYKEGSQTECDEKLCCRANSVNGKGSAGHWGSYENCDSPLRLVQQLVYHINETQGKDFNLLFWTGDNNPHDDWMTTKDSIVFTSTTISKLLQTYLSNEKLIFPILGNHEGMPANQFVLSNDTKFDTHWLYDTLADHWSQWLQTEDALRTFKRGGYYAKTINQHFKVIALNTNLCSIINLWSLYEPIDPANQLQWLVEHLRQSEESNQYVYILGHIAPDMQCTQIWFHNYLRITERFKNTIKGFFYGHTHRDEIKIYYSPYNQSEPIHIGYIGPSVTTWNPAYRFYDLNKDGSVSNIESYYLNLTEANESGKHAKLKWRKSYSAKETYGLETLSADDWNEFYHRLLNNDTLVQIYYRNVIRYADSMPHICDDKCKKNLIIGPIEQHDYFVTL